MTERPILFSGAMMRAILDGRKTQTRRVVRNVGRDNCVPEKKARSAFNVVVHVKDAAHLSPYGVAGDRLWVREAFAVGRPARSDGLGFVDWGGALVPRHAACTKIVYRATSDYGPFSPDWRPSIHMPRWASRLTLEITGVHTERLQEIIGSDVEAEGVEFPNGTGVTPKEILDRWQPFRTLWDGINAGRGFGWDKNPWVFVLTFKRLETTAP